MNDTKKQKSPVLVYAIRGHAVQKSNNKQKSSDIRRISYETTSTRRWFATLSIIADLYLNEGIEMGGGRDSNPEGFVVVGRSGRVG